MADNINAGVYTESELGKLRYELEHSVLKDRFFEMPKAVISKLISESGAYSIYENAFRQWGIANPYRPEDFSIHMFTMENGGNCLCLELPYPEYIPLCYRIYLLSDAKFNRCAYYMVELSSEGAYLSEWRQNEHINHGAIKPYEWPADKRSKMMSAEADIVKNYYLNNASAYANITYQSAPTAYSNQAGAVKVENVYMGIIGALLGSLIGVAAIVLLDMIGFVAAISGVVMAIGTIAMYEKFAGGISKKGAFICIAVMLIMTLFAVNLAYSIQIVREFKEYGYQESIFYAFSHIYEWLQDGILDAGAYVRRLLMTYGFSALGAFGAIKNAISSD